MNIYRVKTERRLVSFGDRMGELPILGVPLSQYQKSVVESCGDHLVDVEGEDQIPKSDYCAFPDHLVISKRAWQHTRKKIAQGSSAFTLELEPNTFNARYVLGSSSDEPTPMPLTYTRKGESPTPWNLPQEIFHHAARLPKSLLANPVYHVDFSPEFVTSIRNPFDLLWANTALNIARAYPIARLVPKRFRPKPGQARMALT